MPKGSIISNGFGTGLASGLVALAVLATSSPAIAQDAQTPKAAQRISHMDFVIEVDFKGGTLRQFVEEIRKAAGPHVVNIIMSHDANELEIPAMHVQSVDVGTALRVAERVGKITRIDGRNVSWDVSQISGDGSPVYTIYHRVLPDSPVPQRAEQAQKKTAVHTITELTTGSGAMSADDVLSAIQAALAMDGGEEVKLAYHEETGLIFARVTGDQGSVIEQTLVNLRLSVQATRRSILEASDREAKEVRTQNLQSQVVLLSSQNSKLKSRIEHLETLLRSRLNGEDAVPENPLGDEPTEGGN